MRVVTNQIFSIGNDSLTELTGTGQIKDPKSKALVSAQNPLSYKGGIPRLVV